MLQQYTVAEGVLRRAAANSGNVHTQKLLGDALAAQNSAEAAVAVYQQVIDATDDEKDRIAATKGLAAMREVMGKLTA